MSVDLNFDEKNTFLNVCSGKVSLRINLIVIEANYLNEYKKKDLLPCRFIMFYGS